MNGNFKKIRLAILACFLLFLVCHLPFSNKLQIFEEEIFNAPDFSKKDVIAQNAINYMVDETVVPDSVEDILRIAVAGTNAVFSQPIASYFDSVLPSEEMSDSLCDKMERRLKPFLDKLQSIKQSTVQEEYQSAYAKAREIAGKLDTWKKHEYWLPLLDFMNQAEESVFQNWYMAKEAFRLSGRFQRGASLFELSKQVAVFGIRCLNNIPDRRLYLDLCVRLQFTTWFRDAAYHLASGIGEWTINECTKMGYHFRAASQKYIIANQLLTDRQYELAIAGFEEVVSQVKRWDFFQSWDWQWYYSNALWGIAAGYKNIGETQKAIYFNNLLADELQAGFDADNTLKALHHKVYAEIARDTGDFERAEEEFAKAQKYVMSDTENGKKIDDTYNSWAITVQIADMHLKDNLPDKAIACLQNWEALARRDNRDFLDAPNIAALFAIYKAKARIRNRDYDRADKLLKYADAMSRNIRSPKIKYQQLRISAEQYAAKKDYKMAIQRLEEAREICIERRLVISEIDVVLALANITRTSENVTEARAFEDELEKIIERIQAIGYKPLLIRALAEIIRAKLKNGYYHIAKNYSEQLFKEVDAIRDSLQRDQRLIYFGHSVHRAIKDAILVDLYLKNKISAFEKLGFAKGYALKRKLAAMETRNIDVKELQSRLKENEALVDYMISEDTVYAFVITNSFFETIAVPASRAQLQEEVSHYLGLLSNPAPLIKSITEREYHDLYGATIDRSHSLYKTLFQQLNPYLGHASKIFIVPDGFLHHIPFGALVTQKKETVRFLIEKKAISYLPGAWMLSHQASADTFSIRKKLFASIDVKLNSSRSLVKKIQRIADPGAEIQLSWQSVGHLKNALQAGQSILLFFSHAKADWDNPAQSFIEIPVDDDAKGKLFYADVESLDLSKTDLIILAACETAGSRIYLGSGLSGLQRAFLASGAKQVLATHWRVASDFTANGVIDYLLALAKNNDPILALQQMQLKTIAHLRKNPLYFNHPFPQLWGAYNLTGFGGSGSVSAFATAIR